MTLLKIMALNKKKLYGSQRGKIREIYFLGGRKANSIICNISNYISQIGVVHIV